MTFPVVEVQADEDVDDESQEGAVNDGIDCQGAEARCTSCDGSGLWRGIDGYVFVCQHCVFEMT
jgi:hypothetical protein